VFIAAHRSSTLYQALKEICKIFLIIYSDKKKKKEKNKEKKERKERKVRPRENMSTHANTCTHIIRACKRAYDVCACADIINNVE
jgi:hypothetical protein